MIQDGASQSVHNSRHQLFVGELPPRSQAITEMCIHLTVALDASRVGGKDVLLLACVGTLRDATQQVALAPPQVGSLDFWAVWGEGGGLLQTEKESGDRIRTFSRPAHWEAPEFIFFHS